ncbi:MAG: ABC transporter ATP-binding protein [Coriobacteriia bacterium]|nr:ABC transporter ATP-binding protein [Coriobacteriia bacterium]
MLELKHISKNYGNTAVLSDISLDIQSGELVSILGPSGSGKTTLLNMILGIADTSSGQIIFKGDDITAMPYNKRGFNIVFQDYALFPNLSAHGNIHYGLRNFPDRSNEEEIAELIELLGLEPHLNKSIEALSGGQKQRVALARTLVMKPEILLLDEPLSALDGVIKESIKAQIRLIAKELELTTIVVTHDPEEALTISDKVLVLDDGCLIQYSTPHDILYSPKSPFIEEFIISQLQTKHFNIKALFDDGEVPDVRPKEVVTAYA